MRAGRMDTLCCSIYHLLTSKSPDKICRKLSWYLSGVVSLARNLEFSATLCTSQHAPLARSFCGARKGARPYVSDCREDGMVRTGSKRHLNETDAWEQNATADDVVCEERFRRGRKSA